jgi:hypothetical protein
MRLHVVLLPSVIACACACGGGGDDRSALEGVYTLASWTDNPTACDAEGGPSFEAGSYSHFFVRDDTFFGERIVSAVMCADLDGCRRDAADRDTLFLGDFAFGRGDDEAGWTGANAFLGGDACDGEVTELLLTGEPGATVQIRGEHKSVSGVPKDGDGFCDLDAAEAQAADQPCERLEIVAGTYLEAI